MDSPLPTVSTVHYAPNVARSLIVRPNGTMAELVTGIPGGRPMLVFGERLVPIDGAPQCENVADAHAFAESWADR